MLSYINAHFVSHVAIRSCCEAVRVAEVPKIIGLKMGFTSSSNRLIQPLLHPFAYLPDPENRITSHPLSRRLSIAIRPHRNLFIGALPQESYDPLRR